MIKTGHSFYIFIILPTLEDLYEKYVLVMRYPKEADEFFHSFFLSANIFLCSLFSNAPVTFHR